MWWGQKSGFRGVKSVWVTLGDRRGHTRQERHLDTENIRSWDLRLVGWCWSFQEIMIKSVCLGKTARKR